MSLSQTATILIDPSLMSPERWEQLQELLQDFSPILEEIGEVLEQNEHEWMESRGDGSWAPLAPSTEIDRQRHGFGDLPDLQRSQALVNALSERDAPGHKFLVSADSVVVGVYGDMIFYADFQASATAHKPARAIIGMMPGTQQAIVDAIIAWLGGGTGISVVLDAAIENSFE